MYRRQKKTRYVVEHKIRLYFTLFIISAGILATGFIYYFDRVIAPTVLLVADAEMRAKAMDIINENIVKIYTEGFYHDIIETDTDDLGKITRLEADTIKLNELAAKVAIEAQNDIEDVGTVGVKVPLGYALKNNILAYFGPEITVKMEPIGRIHTSYESTFESAGINQTRHKIYINMVTNPKIVLPLQSREVEVKHQIPIADNIILGEVPRVSMSRDPLLEGVDTEFNGGGMEIESIEQGSGGLPDLPELGD